MTPSELEPGCFGCVVSPGFHRKEARQRVIGGIRHGISIATRLACGVSGEATSLMQRSWRAHTFSGENHTHAG